MKQELQLQEIEPIQEKSDHEKLMDAYARLNIKLDELLEKRRQRKLG